MNLYGAIVVRRKKDDVRGVNCPLSAMDEWISVQTGCSQAEAKTICRPSPKVVCPE